jgi:hypothetical protein
MARLRPDKPILSERTMLDLRDRIERRFAVELPALIKRAQSKGAIVKIIKDNCWGLWLYGFKEGREHAVRELSLLGVKTNRFSLVKDAPQGAIENRRAEEAISVRTNTLAGNVANSEWEKIQGYLTTNVKGEVGREQLVTAIAEVLGGDRFRARARTIARTELASAYNSGRLRLNNAVARLDDWFGMQRINAPSHPNCRCVLSPVIDLEQLAVASQPPPLESNTWLANDILKAVTGG